MSVTLFRNLIQVDVTHSTFPGGESCIRINSESRGDKDTEIMISLAFQNNGDLIDLAMMLDACKRHYHPGAYYILYMPYLPYARQDRVCNAGESLSVKVVCDFINGLGFPKVVVKDIHSSVGVALLNNLSHVEQIDCASTLPHYIGSNTVVVAPDAGSAKKAFDFAKKFGYDLVHAAKVRDMSTGKIIETKLLDPIPEGADLIIIDDICDFGGTFVALEKVLRPLTTGKISLYVTHGLFSGGVDKFLGVFDKIYTSNLMMKKEFSDTYGIIQVV